MKSDTEDFISWLEADFSRWCEDSKQQQLKEKGILEWATVANALDVRVKLSSEFDRELQDILIPFVVEKINDHDSTYLTVFPELLDPEIFFKLKDNSLFIQFFESDGFERLMPSLYKKMEVISTIINKDMEE